MLRRIIHIDEEKCSGCGACAAACHEGAIDMVEGKAKLTREDYCDGLGDCLPACPTDAITFEEREAPAYNEAAVLASKREKASAGCPGVRARAVPQSDAPAAASVPSRLSNWPIQIKLAPVRSDCFDGADLLIAADCTAFSYGNFHEEFMKGRTTLIGCPKLDDVDYSEKLSRIIALNDIKSITVTRMEVPCCGGLSNAVKKALLASGKNIPLNIVVVSVDGQLRA